MEKFIAKFKKGTQYVNVASAVTKKELTNPGQITDDYLNQKCVKFIPASGAATRMFKDLYSYINEETTNASVDKFFEHISEFAFYEDILDLVKSENLDLSEPQDRINIVKYLLDGKMNYGHLPKALIKMHTYDDFSAVPIDEHIYEGEQYLNGNEINLHFTISKEHQDLFKEYVKHATKDKENVHISYSFQKKETDTLAVDMNDEPFVLENGDILYRAGGHGALIENLNDIEADIIFIKNVDNVCHRKHIEDTIDYKKKLAAIGFEIKSKIDKYILALSSDDYDISEIEHFVKSVLKIKCKQKLTEEKAMQILDRPFRVCGMVKNQGEPGGGPFVVENDGCYDLQICEKSEIDLNDDYSSKILNDSEYFNPVDLVCFVKRYDGSKYNLLDYINEERYFISEKTYRGRHLKALEHPGLWNGAMHHWNTAFVEVPISTFNPVKTVNDLLREGHRG